MLDHSRLTKFLNAANKATYANREASKSTSLRPASEDYHFEEDDLIYHDTYFGARNFIGEEVVYENNIPVWGMNYYGQVLKEEVSTADAYKILRPALMQEYENILPVRGPKIYTEGEHTYRNSVNGSLDSFSGIEEIYIKDELVYRCWYHGGDIK